MAQPIVRGIQAVGSVDVTYKYGGDGILPVPPGIIFGTGEIKSIDTSNRVRVAGFRLDSQFIRAQQQVASSQMIPILGGGGIALTNNNRTGTLSIASTRVSSPDIGNKAMMTNALNADGDGSKAEVYDLVLLAQCQQAAAGGDSVGAEIEIKFNFGGKGTILTFEMCTIANVAPIVLAGNDAADYGVEINYLNWRIAYSDTAYT